MNNFCKNETERGFNVRTDLAYEDAARVNNLQDTNCHEYNIDNIPVICTKVGKKDEQLINKREGLYYTIDLTNVKMHDHEDAKKMEKALLNVLLELIEKHQLTNKKCLVIGLGNVNVTPDSLGPYVLDNVIVTRHLFELGSVHEGYSEVSGFSPGVMGNTGIETFDIIKSVVDKINVDYVIVVDALAAASISRVNRTIQVTDAGINPGSGVGNARKEISSVTLGKPVIAIGVPTVVDAVTITSDVIDYIVKYLGDELNTSKKSVNKLTPGVKDYERMEEPNEEVKKHFLGEVGSLTYEEKKDLINQVLTPSGYNMMVTPKEVDADIEDLAHIIATSIDLALHPSLRENITL